MSTAFQKGSKAAAKQGSSFTKGIPYFSMKADEKVIVRFLTDAEAVKVGDTEAGGWISVLQHNHIQTKANPAPKAEDGKATPWPQFMTAVCRNDPAFGGSFDDCFLCLAGIKKTNRTWALVVMREEVRDADGKRTGIRDVKREDTRKDANGVETTIQVPDIRVINAAGKNFFNRVATYASYYDTVLDRDYVVTRTGDGLDTDYGTIALDPIDLADGGKYDLRNPELMKRYLPEAETVGYAQASDNVLGPIVEEKASDEYFAKFFDSRVAWKPPAKDAEGKETAPATVTPAPANDATDVSLDALRARITGHGAEAAAPVAAPVEEVAAPAVEAPAAPAPVAEGKVVALVD